MVIRQKILITGANGQLGNEFRNLSGNWPEYQFIFAGREELPMDDQEKINNYLGEQQPHIIVNCAAYTAVDKAEQADEKAALYAINADAPAILAAYCKENGASFVHISTDYVFDGQGSSPYKEDHPTDPVNQYGASKLAGEQQVMAANPDSIIIRTAWVYSAHGKNFVKTMLRLMKERSEISVVNDQSGTPTYAADLADAIMQIIRSGNREAGIYHYSNEGAITWFDLAVAIGKRVAPACVVHPIPTSQFPTPAKRPAYSVLDKSKIKNTFGVSIPGWEQSLDVCLGKF